MRQALRVGWFLFKHRHCPLEGYVISVSFSDPLSTGQKVGVKCHRHISLNGAISTWGLVFILRR